MLDILFLVAGAFLTVVSMTWAAGTSSTAGTAGWTAFGVSIGVTVLAVASAGFGRNLTRQVGHGLLGLVGIWSLVAAVVFTGTAQTWLIFADAIAVGLLALADLAVHEATTERVVHQLEIREPSREGVIA